MLSPIPVSVVTHDNYVPWLAKQSDTTQCWLEQNGFKTTTGNICAVPGKDGQIAQIVCAAGNTVDMFTLAPLAKKYPGRKLVLDDWQQPAAQQMALGFMIACYSFDRYKNKNHEFAELLIPDEFKSSELLVTAQSVHWVRDLVNTPTEDLGPEQLAEEMSDLAQRMGAKFKQIVGDQLLKENFPAIHAVGRAASRPPRLLQLSWGKADAPTVVLVGKGVCFDTGGLNLKTGNYMLLMKKDMGGAAHVLGLAQMVMSQNLPIRLEVLIPAVENAVSGNAFRPGDVLNTRAGISVEVGNTDAEGRLVLSDALTLAMEMQPDLVLDFATLTGAARVALGPELPVLFSNNQTLASQLLEVSQEQYDPLWQLPLHQAYRKLLSSQIADINNVSNGPMAGCITAALFLEHFVEADVDWCHLDVYAWNPANRPGRPKGGEAQGIRAYFEFLKNRYQ